MKVTNSGNNDILDITSTKKNRKTNRVDVNARAESSAGATGEAPSVELSSEAKALAKANSIARSEDVDQAKIDQIKAMIAERKYNPDYAKVADKVVNETLLQDLA